ncbi:uncharacterized protein LOC101889987 [Musca domestica]|uniref:Uncharacterized protein LOC101889987 n=1 Tax=Musca domestica TaxID=7370 RepID=A0A1I8MYM4_MUSDO|nr:uncharacterized protein LOC101889987 [Musca domestica]
MSGNKKKLSCDFDIEAKIPKGLYENFVAVQASLMGLRGYIEATAQGFKGRLETENKELLEKIKQIMEKSKDFMALITKTVFTEIKEIEKITEETFKIK